MSGDRQQGETECGHPTCRSDDIELLVRDAAALVLGDDEFTRVCVREAPGVKPDFRSPRHALEVKQLTSPGLLKFFAERAKHLGDEDPRIPIDCLTEVWGVWADLSDAIESFDITTEIPDAKLLTASLIPVLKDMEARGVTDAFADQNCAWPRIRALLGHGALCSVIPGAVVAGMKPGIFFAVAHGLSRSTYLEDDVVVFLQKWLDSEHSTNARQSLAGEKVRRILGLAASMDGPAAAMLRTLSETPGAIPRPLRLPSEIDALVVTTVQEVLLFDGVTGWHRHAANL